MIPAPVSADMIKAFLSTFVAADPNATARCAQLINGSAVSPAQHAQDVFPWRNLFAGLALGGRKGYYVESGANYAVKGSNTWFYDRCLGWPGLCVEPMKTYHAGLQQHRTCALAPHCISPRDGEQTTMSRGGPLSHVGGGPRGVTVTCHTLRSLLQMHHGGRHGPHHAQHERATGSRVARAGVPPPQQQREHETVVDFWSLDVEGLELSILESLDGWRGNGLRVRAVLVEDNKLDSRRLDDVMGRAGYRVFARFLADTLYVRRPNPRPPTPQPADPATEPEA